LTESHSESLALHPGGRPMSVNVNPAATHHMPIFIMPPGNTEILMAVTAVFLLIVVVAFGLLFLRLHSLPGRMATAATSCSSRSSRSCASLPCSRMFTRSRSPHFCLR
jgi:hypothetical protein